MLFLADPVRFLGGHAGAIRRVCENGWSLLVGAIFVATAVIARNYDQAAIFREPMRILAPYAFSLFSSIFLFGVLFRAFRLRQVKAEASFGQQYLSFLAAFWMTAPIAWLYAIPVERFMEPADAAQTNWALLVIVSLWRVILIARVTQVVSGARYSACLIYIVAARSSISWRAKFHLGRFRLSASYG